MFGDILGKLLQERGVTAYKLAIELNISQSLISQWKHNKQVPNGENLSKIANYFNVSADYLLGEAKQTAVVPASDLTEHEKRVIFAYRNNPLMQSAVDKLLSVYKESNCEIAKDMCEVLRQADNIRLPIKKK
jgi:transcriptional regulator with XRE-family HTH domain